MKKYATYALAVGAFAALVVAVLLMTGQVGGSKKPDATKAAGMALTLDFNKAYAQQGVAIVKVLKCADVSEEQGATANEFACLAQVGGVPAAQSCGAFVFVTDAEHTKVVQRVGSQPVDPSNCGA